MVANFLISVDIQRKKRFGALGELQFSCKKNKVLSAKKTQSRFV